MGEDPISLSRRFCKEFHQDMEYLHCLPPTVEPRVSDHMPQIIDMIKQVCLFTVLFISITRKDHLLLYQDHFVPRIVSSSFSEYRVILLYFLFSHSTLQVIIVCKSEFFHDGQMLIVFIMFSMGWMLLTTF